MKPAKRPSTTGPRTLATLLRKVWTASGLTTPVGANEDGLTATPGTNPNAVWVPGGGEYSSSRYWSSAWPSAKSPEASGMVVLLRSAVDADGRRGGGGGGGLVGVGRGLVRVRRAVLVLLLILGLQAGVVDPGVRTDDLADVAGDLAAIDRQSPRVVPGVVLEAPARARVL